MTEYTTFKGVRMTKNQAKIIKFIDTNEYQQGARFTKQDIEHILHHAQHPSNADRKRMKLFDKEMDSSYRKNE